ncbi:hypothetical protein BG000_006857 [Podila horticola]|nr:hypothetical protein BG000_006857 [Podila horticola]
MNPAELPNDILHLSFKKLDTKSVYACSMTCKDWQPAAGDEIWSCRSITIGDPQSEQPSFPSSLDFLTFSSLVGNLTLSPELNRSTMAQYNPANLSALRELHVMSHICLATPPPALPGGGASSDENDDNYDDDTPFHWVHKLAVRNRDLRVLSLASHSPFGVAIQRVAFKISNYFRKSPDLTNLELTSLKLRYFALSAHQLANLLQFCPKPTRLELEHVDLGCNSPRLQAHAGRLQELVLLQTLPTAWFLQTLGGGVKTLVLKGHIRPATVQPATQGIRWTIPLAEFNRLMMTMPLLVTLTVDRVGMDIPSNGEKRAHPKVREVFATEGIEFGNHFVNAKVLPYKE